MMWFSASLRQDVKYKSNMHVILFSVCVATMMNHCIWPKLLVNHVTSPIWPKNWLNHVQCLNHSNWCLRSSKIDKKTKILSSHNNIIQLNWTFKFSDYNVWSIYSLAIPFKFEGGLEPSCHGLGGSTPSPVCQRTITEGQKTIHSHIHTLGQFRITD